MSKALTTDDLIKKMAWHVAREVKHYKSDFDLDREALAEALSAASTASPWAHAATLSSPSGRGRREHEAHPPGMPGAGLWLGRIAPHAMAPLPGYDLRPARPALLRRWCKSSRPTWAGAHGPDHIDTAATAAPYKEVIP